MAVIINEAEKPAGAVLGTFLNEEVVVSFGNSTSEYQAACEGSALIDLSNFARYEITGRDRARYLHGLISSEVNKLDVGTGSYGTFMNTTGRTLSDAWVYAQEDRLLLILPLGVDAVIMKHLDFYLIADKAEFVPISTSTRFFSLQGPLVKDTLTQLGVAPPKESYCMKRVEIAGFSVQVMAVSRSGTIGFDILVAKEEAKDVWEAILEAGATPIGFDALNMVRVVHGIPWSGKELTEKVIPMEANLTDIAVSFNKGCYLGQEVVAKIKYRGKVNRLMTALELPVNHGIEEGALLYYLGKKMGWISSIVTLPTGEQKALGFLRRSAYENAETVDLSDGDDPKKAKVVHLEG